MKYIQSGHLPEVVFNAFVRILEKHEHRQGDYSSTGLPKSPRQLRLIERHYDDIVVNLDSAPEKKAGENGPAPANRNEPIDFEPLGDDEVPF